MTRWIWLPTLFAALGFAALAQDTGRRRALPAYSADEVVETVRTLADGTHLTHTSTNKVYRDSEGRTRTELRMSGPNGADGPTMILIFDPVANVHYMMNTREKVAHKHVIAAPQSRPFASGTTGSAVHGALSAAPGAVASKPHEVSDAERPTHTDEDLGTQTIDGFLVEGRRHTIVWPAGSSMGNDRPVTTIDETWTSPELGVVVLSKRNDPQIGETTRKLVSISRVEPDPGLFQPPADYTVETADGSH